MATRRSPRAKPDELVDESLRNGPLVDRLFVLVVVLLPFVAVLDLFPSAVRTAYLAVLSGAVLALTVYGLRDAYHWLRSPGR